MDIKPSCENCKFTFNAIDEAPCNHCIRALSDMWEPDDITINMYIKEVKRKNYADRENRKEGDVVTTCRGMF